MNSLECTHDCRRCLNYYDTIPKYICEDCGIVHMCACDEPLATQFLPHQTRKGSEYGTRKRHPVAGFAPNLCPTCRGEPEPACPMAAVPGRKGKIERYYWREITKTYHSLARDYGFWKYGDRHRTIPGKFGARASKLYLMLKDGSHYGVKLPEEDMHRITLWLDSCSVFYGVYEKEGGEAQLRGEVVRPTLE